MRTTTTTTTSYFLEDRKKKISELSEKLVQKLVPREILSGDNIEDEQLAEENYVKCVEFCRENCRPAFPTSSSSSKEEVKRECVDILDRFAREAQMSKRCSLTILFDALEREYGRNRTRFTYEDEDDEEFWSKIALFLLRSAGKPMKSAYEPSNSSVLKSLEVEGERRAQQRQQERRGRREQEENAPSIDVSIRHPRTGTCHRSKNKNERLESSSDSLSEWSDSEEEEEKRKGGRIRREGTISSPKQTKKEEEEEEEENCGDNRNDNILVSSFESLSSDRGDEASSSDDDIEGYKGDAYSIRIREEAEENANEEDPGFSWRSFPGNTDGESLDAREFHSSVGSSILGTLSTSHQNARRISRASFVQMQRARRMLRKLHNSAENKDDEDTFFLSSRIEQRNRMSKYKTIGESSVVSRTLNTISSGGVADFDIESMEIPHVSKNAVANVLKSSKQIMDVFEDVGRVRHRLNNLSSLFAVEGKQSPTVQAFVNALMTMKVEIQHGFDELFEATRRASVNVDTFSAPTLLRLSIESRKLARKASCLQRIAEMCSPGPKSSVGKFAHPATASSTILSMLYNLMNEYNGLSGSLDEFSIVFRCFFSSSTSYFNALDVWINYGILTSPEIFVDAKKSTRWRDGWYLREDKDVPIFLKSVAEEVLNAGIHREFSRMKFTGEDKDIQDEAGKKLTFVSKMISELKALLLLRASTKSNDENNISDDNEAADEDSFLRTNEPTQIEQKPSQRRHDDIDVAFCTEDTLISDLKNVVSLTKARSKKSALFSHSSKEATKTTFGECYDFIKWVSTYFKNGTSTTLGIPVNTLVSKSMLNQIRLAAMNASEHALQQLKTTYGLKAELMKLRALFLSGCGDVALDFFNHVFEEFESIRRHRQEEKIGESMAEATMRFDTTRLTEVLRDAIFEHTNEGTFGSRESIVNRIDEVRVQVFYTHPSPDDEYKGCDELQALTDLNIIYEKNTRTAVGINSNAIVASIICDAVSLSKYNEVFKYLMQLRYAQRSLDYGVLSQWTSERRRTETSPTLPTSSQKTLSISSSLEIELKHFVLTLRSFMTTKILSVEWNRLLESINEFAQSIDDVKLAHEVYVDNISRVALVSSDSTWSLLSTHIKTILAIASEFGNLRRQEEEEGDVGVKLRELATRRMEKKFTVARTNVLKILRNSDSESGSDAERLYEQLNFNNYYCN